MLVLSRKPNESILAGSIRIRILRVNGDNVRIGIEAPLSMPVDREEVFLRKMQAGQQAATPSVTPLTSAGLVDAYEETSH